MSLHSSGLLSFHRWRITVMLLCPNLKRMQKKLHCQRHLREEDGRIALLAYQLTQTEDSVSLTTAWQVETRSLNKPAPRRVFIHVLAEDGTVAAQSDFLAADYASLFPEDLLFQTQKISLGALPLGNYWVQIGLYNPDNGMRFLLDDGSDRVLLFPLVK